MEPKLSFIKEAYFKKNMAFVKMLDSGNLNRNIEALERN